MINPFILENGAKLQTWRFKKDMPPHLQSMGLKVDRRFEEVWIARDYKKDVLLESGDWMPTAEFYLKTPGRVIGPRDMQAAGNLSWAHEWRQAYADWRMEMKYEPS